MPSVPNPAVGGLRRQADYVASRGSESIEWLARLKPFWQQGFVLANHREVGSKDLYPYSQIMEKLAARCMPEQGPTAGGHFAREDILLARKCAQAGELSTCSPHVEGVGYFESRVASPTTKPRPVDLGERSAGVC